MSEILLEPEDQTAVVAKAAKILRERVIGGVDGVCISPVDTDFLALAEEDVGKKFPELLDTDSPEQKEAKLKQYPVELDILSVERVVLSCIDELLQRNNDVPEENVSQEIVQNICKQVISILKTRKLTKATKLPRRLAEAVENNLTRIEEEISQMETEVDQKMELLKEEGVTEEEKWQLYTEIHQLLIKIREYNQKIIDIHKLYDISSLHRSEEEDWEVFEEDWGWTDDPGGWLWLLDRDGEPENTWWDPLTLEEDISLSWNEKILLQFVPKKIQESDEFSQKKYFWHEQGEEWQRGKFDIKDYPQVYAEMLRLLIQRKKIVAFYAEKSIYEQRWVPAENNNIKNLRREIHDLEETVNKIQLVGDDDLEEATEERQYTPENTTPEEQAQRQIESNLEFMYENLELNLIMYVKNVGIRTRAANEVRKYIQEIWNTIRHLTLHCEKHSLESQYIFQVQAEGEGGEGDIKSDTSDDNCLSLEEYIDDPNYFTSFPEALNVSLSEAEKQIQQLCHVDIENSLLPSMAWWKEIGLVYEEEDGTESSMLKKMEAVEGVIEIIQRRKMLIYFYAHQKIQEETSPEIMHHLETLKGEIETIQTSLNMLTRRIVWETQEDANKGRDLHIEIEDLWQKRFRLFQVFVEAQNHRERAIIGQKIFTYCHALEERRGELDQIPDKPEPDEYIKAPPLNTHESYCLQYVLHDIQMSEEQLFSDKIWYTGKKLSTEAETRKEKKKLVWSLVTERKMLIYFFMMSRILEIDMSLLQTEGATESETLMQEREKLEWYIDIFQREIAEWLRRIASLETIPTETKKPPKLEYQKLYNEAMKTLWSLDGALAHNEKHEYRDLLRTYWLRIQEQVLHFSVQIQKAEKENTTQEIPTLQKDFDYEMGLIIEDIRIFLKGTLAAQWYSWDDPERIIRHINSICTNFWKALQKANSAQ